MQLNKIYTVDIYFYLEGCDPDCSNSIQYSTVDLQLGFMACLAGRGMSMNKKENNKTVRSRLYTSVLLVLLALVAVTAATVAWFSIADRAKVKTMSLDIVTDADLRMDLDPHSTIDQYVKTLSFEQIAARIQQEKGFPWNNPAGTGDNNRL